VTPEQSVLLNKAIMAAGPAALGLSLGAVVHGMLESNMTPEEIGELVTVYARWLKSAGQTKEAMRTQAAFDQLQASSRPRAAARCEHPGQHRGPARQRRCHGRSCGECCDEHACLGSEEK
jgi:hypothetical protein